MNRYIPLILTGVLLNAAAQIFLKLGMKAIGEFSFSLTAMIPAAVRVCLSPFIIAGMACYGISVVIWLLVLSRVDVTYAYPMLSVGYIATAFAGTILLGEIMTPFRWLGVLVICAGVVLITRTA
jgi:multidrug transporter EmrE-like cation transporter